MWSNAGAFDCLQAEDPNKSVGTAAAAGTEDKVSVEQSTQADEDAGVNVRVTDVRTTAADSHREHVVSLQRESIETTRTEMAEQRINFMFLFPVFIY